MLFIVVFMVCAFALYICSESRWFLSSPLGRWLFATYYQFDFDNTAACVRLRQASDKETSARLLARSQFGIVLKNLDNPQQSQFHLVALHQGALNDKPTQRPLLNFEEHVRSMTQTADDATHMLASATIASTNEMQQQFTRSLTTTFNQHIQAGDATFMQSFQLLFDKLRRDPSALITFHVFDMEHVFELERLLGDVDKKFHMAHFEQSSNEPFYVSFEVKSEPRSPGILGVLGGQSPTTTYCALYNSVKHHSQTAVFHDQKSTRAVHIIREDKERFEAAGKQQEWGKYGLSAFSFLTLFTVVRSIVFDDETCWDLSLLQGKFVHVNSICAASSTNWFTSRAQPQSVLLTVGFWSLSFLFTCCYFVMYQLGGLVALLMTTAILYFVIADGKWTNRVNFCYYAFVVHFPLFVHIWVISKQSKCESV